VDSSAWIPVGGFHGWILEWFGQESTPGGLFFHVNIEIKTFYIPRWAKWIPPGFPGEEASR